MLLPCVPTGVDPESGKLRRVRNRQGGVVRCGCTNEAYPTTFSQPSAIGKPLMSAVCRVVAKLRNEACSGGIVTMRVGNEVPPRRPHLPNVIWIVTTTTHQHDCPTVV